MERRNGFAIRKVCSAVSALLVLALVLVILPGIAKADEVMITFDARGGSPTPDPVRTTGNALAGAYPDTNPSKDDYTFAGWFTQPTGGTIVTETTSFSEDTTVYAHWIGTVSDLTLGSEDQAYWTANTKGATTTRTATVTVTPNDAEAPAITWTTSNASVVSLSGTSGKTVTLTAEGNGTATVVAKCVGQTVTCFVTVSILPPASVSMTGTVSGTVGTPLTAGESFILTLTNATFNAASGDVTGWFTNIPSDLSATAETTAAGSTTLKVNIAGEPKAAGTDIQAKCTVPASANSSGSDVILTPSSSAVYNIASAPTPSSSPDLPSFKLDPAKKTLYDSQTVQLQLTDIKPADAVIVSATFASSNASVASVDANGLVTAKGYGTATITAIAKDENGNNVSATSTITVLPKIYLSFDPNNSQLGKDDSVEMTIEITNPSEEYAWVKRSNKRIYYSGYTKKVTAKNGTVWYLCKLNNGKAKLTIKPQYNGKATVTVAHSDAASVSADFTVHGYHNLPATGQNSTLIYILSGVGVLVAAGLVAAYVVKRKKENAV